MGRGRVLVVDDDRAMRRLVAFALGEEGYDVAGAADPDAGLAAARERPPGLVLLDSFADTGAAADFVRACRRLAPPRPAVVFCSAWPDAARRAAELGTDGVLAKPFDLDDLLALAARHAAGPG